MALVPDATLCRKNICMFSLWIASRDRLRLASAGLAVTAATTATAASGLSSLVSGLLAVVVAAGVAVTESYPHVSPIVPSQITRLTTYRPRCQRSHGHRGERWSHCDERRAPWGYHACRSGQRCGRQPSWGEERVC